jgi:hypothetical protein
MQVSTRFVDAYEDYNCLCGVSFFVVSKVSNWKKERRLSFFVKLKKTATETFEMLKSAYGEECLSRTSVFEWRKSSKKLRKRECKNRW